MARTNNLSNFLSDVADAIRTKKGSQELIAAEDFDTEIENLPSGGERVEAPDNDVIFYDYDGFRIYSYSKSEFLALETMPANPEHNGLMAQGWNWSLADAKEYVSDYGMLDIGQNYITDDGKTRIYIRLEDGRLTPRLHYTCDGTSYINWGDGSEIEEASSGEKQILHTYSSAGNYKISLYTSSNEPNTQITIYSDLIQDEVLNVNMNYAKIVEKIEIGSNIKHANSYSAFRNCGSLQTITLPNNFFPQGIPSLIFSACYSLKFVTIPYDTYFVSSLSAFNNCYSLKNICLPKHTQTSSSSKELGKQFFYNCYSLSRLTIPNVYTKLGQDCFNGAYNLKKVVIPDSIVTLTSGSFKSCNGTASYIIPNTITNIPDSTFMYNSFCKYFDFSEYTAVPTLANANVFTGMQDDCKIIVPDDLYEDWIAATNWSSYASNIISKSDWDALQNA